MKAIITSILLAGVFFCTAAENKGKETKPNGKATTTKIVREKEKPADSITTSGTKVAKTKKVKKNTYFAPWINNNGGGNTSYH